MPPIQISNGNRWRARSPSLRAWIISVTTLPPLPLTPQIIPFFMFHKSAVTNKLKSRRGTLYSARRFKCSNTQIHFIISKKTLNCHTFKIYIFKWYFNVIWVQSFHTDVYFNVGFCQTLSFYRDWKISNKL